jgi:hypothetical protein
MFGYLFDAKDGASICNATAPANISSPVHGVINIGGPNINIVFVNRGICP